MSIYMKLARVLALVLLSLLALLVMTANARGEEPRAIAITAKRFEFVPSTITLKKGETVTLVVTSEDVTHGLFLRPLKIDADLTAGETMSAGSHRNTRRGWTLRGRIGVLASGGTDSIAQANSAPAVSYASGLIHFPPEI